MASNSVVLLYVITTSLLVQTSIAMQCYQCSGTDNNSPFQCNEFLGNDHDLTPDPCDNVYEAQYCIKHTGRFEALAIDCYQCSSSELMECGDGMIHFGGIAPHNCSQVFEAQYCIKSTGLAGGIGTKRFCSSLDLGNYCNYVKQPGDILSYRTCIYTCTGDGCNSGISISPLTVLYIIMSIVTCFKYIILR